MKRFSASCAFLALALASATVTSAQSILEYFSGTSPALTVTPAGTSQTLQIQGFDSNLGTLTDVKITISGLVSQLAKGENIGAGATPYSYNLGATAAVDRGATNLFTSSLVSLTGSGNVSGTDGTLDFKGPSAFHSYPNENTPQTTDTVLAGVYAVPLVDLASYVSSGKISFTARASGNSTLTGSGNMLMQSTNLANLGVTVDYTYSPIPEPSVCALALGCAVLGLSVLRHRTRLPAPADPN